MKKAILFAITLALIPAFASADEPIKNLEAFEAKINACLLKDNKPSACLGQALGGHFSPGNERLNEVVVQVASVLNQWLAGNKVFAVHPVLHKKVGAFYEEKAYLIEDATGSIILLETSFINTLGKWYLHRFNLSSKKERMRAVLGADL